MVWAVGQSLLHPFLPPVPRTADPWSELDRSYGAETVNRVLERHPIKVRVSTDWWREEPRKRERVLQEALADVHAAAEYCHLWLERYASEVAIPQRASRFLVLGTAAVPAILLLVDTEPGALVRLFKFDEPFYRLRLDGDASSSIVGCSFAWDNCFRTAAGVGRSVHCPNGRAPVVRERRDRLAGATASVG